MRWFKHMTASGNDEKLSRLKDRYGLEGYGFWWTIVEIIAGFVDENGKTSVTFSAKKWGNLAGISAKKFQTLAEFCANLGCFSIKNDENSITIDMPNILKYRDEWSKKKGKNSGETPEKLRSKDTDIYIDTDNNTPPISPPCKNTNAGGVGVSNPKHTDCPSKGNPQWKAFLSCWQVYPVQQDQEGAWREWMRLHQNGTLADCFEIRDAILTLTAKDTRWQNGKVPTMANWLNRKRWNDKPYQETTRASPATNAMSWSDREWEQTKAEFLASTGGGNG